MTLDPQLVNLVQLLTSGRTSQRLNWTLTSDPNIFRLVLDEGLIRIERTPGVTSDEPRQETYYYGITVLDKEGTTVLGGFDMYSQKDFGALANLYEQVSRRLHGDTVGKIMKELRSKLDKMPA
jgi:hypothetical protein